MALRIWDRKKVNEGIEEKTKGCYLFKLGDSELTSSVGQNPVRNPFNTGPPAPQSPANKILRVARSLINTLVEDNLRILDPFEGGVGHSLKEVKIQSGGRKKKEIETERNRTD